MSTGLAWIVGLSVVVCLRALSPTTAVAAYALLFCYTLANGKCAARALFALWLLTMLSPALSPPVSGEPAFKYIIVAGATVTAVRLAGVLPPLWKMPTISTIALGVLICIHSIAVSPFPELSILKAAFWTVTSAVCLSLWLNMSAREARTCANEIYYALAAVALVSIPFLFSPDGYLMNGTGFQGVLNHPQNLGSSMALLFAWAAGRFLEESRPRWVDIFIAALAGTLILRSEARTAAFAVLIGIISALVITFARRRPTLLGLRSYRTGLLAAVALLLLLASSEQLSTALDNLVSKSGRADATTVTEAYRLSRGRLIDRMLENISKYPLTGIGFGIASNPESMDVSYSMGIPTGAPVEKGVTFLAVPEELGLPAAILVAGWMLLILVYSIRSSFRATAVTLTVLGLNLGEATMFSAGGMGLLSLVLLGWAAGRYRRATHASR